MLEYVPPLHPDDLARFEPCQPCTRRRRLRRTSSPDLTAGCRVIVQQSHTRARFSSADRRSYPGWPRAHNDCVEVAIHDVRTSIPGSQSIWQVLRCATPFTVERHSKQMPIPHRGARGSPTIDVRVVIPAIKIAAATVVPDATVNGTPLIVMLIFA